MNAQASRAKQIAEKGYNLPGPLGPKKGLRKHFEQTEQGLNFQPFIFAIAQCIPDLEEKNRADLHGIKSAQYRDGGIKITALKQGLSRAGYSFVGTRISSSPQQPEHAYIIAERASACTDMLVDHFHWLKGVGKAKEAQSFTERLAAFQGAVETIIDQREIATFERERVERAKQQRRRAAINPIGEGYMCALD